MHETDRPIYKFCFDNVEVDERQRELRVNGQAVALEPRPLALLLALLNRPGEVLTREELMESLWDGRVTVPNVLANAISKIRDALGEPGSKCLMTVPRVGYRFDGSLMRELVGRTAPSEPDASLRAGQRVPGRETSYVLIEQLGSSTRHPVWRARHVQLDETRVFKFAFGGEQLASLKRELTLTRYLAGTLGGQDGISFASDANFSETPFYLEFQDFGEDLLSWSEHSPMWHKLDHEQRIALFERIASVVAQAHSVGVLHKDIKPGNILIKQHEGELEVRLADFGSGRVESLETLAAAKIPPAGMTVSDVYVSPSRTGTWLYMAPEVQRGQPYTMAADVYALGLLLFQLVSHDLQRSLSSDWRRWVDDPELQFDIERATAGQPLERTNTAQALLDSVAGRKQRRQARLDGLKCAAAQALAQQLAMRAKARRPWVLASIGLLTIAVIAASVLTYQTRQALLAARQAQSQATAISTFLLKDVLRAADMTRSEAGAKPTAELSSVLRMAAARVGERFADQPAIEARVRSQLGEAFARTSAPEAEAELLRALALYDKHPDLETRGAVYTRLVHARLLAILGRVAAAKEAVQRVQPYFDILSPDTDPALWARKHHTDNAIAWAAHDYPAALSAARSYSSALLSVPDISPSERHSALLVVAEALSRTGQLKEASQLFQQSTQTPFLPHVIGPYAWAFAKCRQSLQELQSGDLDAAQQSLDAANAVVASLPEVEPNLAYDLQVGQAYIHEMKGRLSDAANAYELAYDAAMLAHGADSPVTHQAQSNAAIMQSYVGRPLRALGLIEEAQRWAIQHSKKKDVGGEPPGFSLLEFHRALVLTNLARPGEALRSLQALNAESIAAEDAAQGWPARFHAETLRARLALKPSKALRDEFADTLIALKKSGAPDWVVQRYERMR